MKEVLTCFVLCFGTWVGCDDLFRMTMDFVPFVFSALFVESGVYQLCGSCQFICLRLELRLHFVPVRRLFIAETAAG